MSMHSNFNDNGLRHVFAYGSLIWRPGFEHLGTQKALLRGAHRSLCVYSHRYRGTPDNPGLVFGLRNGGSCHGLVFEVAEDRWAKVREYLWQRELIGGVYRPVRRMVRTETGELVEALTFVALSKHKQYAGRLSLHEQADLVRTSAGSQGPNIEYVVNTAQHLREIGIADHNLDLLRTLLERDQAGSTSRS